MSSFLNFFLAFGQVKLHQAYKNGRLCILTVLKQTNFYVFKHFIKTFKFLLCIVRFFFVFKKIVEDYIIIFYLICLVLLWHLYIIKY